VHHGSTFFGQYNIKIASLEIKMNSTPISFNQGEAFPEHEEFLDNTDSWSATGDPDQNASAQWTFDGAAPTMATTILISSYSTWDGMNPATEHPYVSAHIVNSYMADMIVLTASAPTPR
jgi:hypothetical protein